MNDSFLMGHIINPVVTRSNLWTMPSRPISPTPLRLYLFFKKSLTVCSLEVFVG